MKNKVLLVAQESDDNEPHDVDSDTVRFRDAQARHDQTETGNRHTTVVDTCSSAIKPIGHCWSSVCKEYSVYMLVLCEYECVRGSSQKSIAFSQADALNNSRAMKFYHGKVDVICSSYAKFYLIIYVLRHGIIGSNIIGLCPQIRLYRQQILSRYYC